MANPYHTTEFDAANAGNEHGSHFAFSPKHQNAKLAAPISSASTGAASNLSRESEAAA